MKKCVVDFAALQELLAAKATVQSRPPCEAHVNDLHGDAFAITLLRFIDDDAFPLFLLVGFPR